MPHGHYAGDATLGPEGRIYLKGGGNSQRTNDGRWSNLRYDPRADRWEDLDPVPGWIVTEYVVVFIKPGEWKWVPNAEAGSVTGVTRNTDLKREGDGVAVAAGRDGRIYWLGGRGRWLGPGEAGVGLPGAAAVEAHRLWGGHGAGGPHLCVRRRSGDA